MGLGLNKILFDGMLFKILKKMVCPSERDIKEQNIQRTTLASLFLTLILNENQMGCLLFSLSKPCKEGEGNKKDVSFCSLFRGREQERCFLLLFISLSIFYDNIYTFTLGMSFCVPLNNVKKINSTAKR